jgi:putative endonuclease
MSSSSGLARGKLGEKLAVKLLQKKGLKILEKNFRSKVGEIDIIALESSKEPTLVFIEVKARWTKEYGPPEEAVTPRKIRSIIKTGQYYSHLHPELPKALRVDVVSIDFTQAHPPETAKVRLIKNVTEMLQLRKGFLKR